MNDETAAALKAVIEKATELHDTANDPQEDRCDELVEWIEQTFSENDANSDKTFSASIFRLPR